MYLFISYSRGDGTGIAEHVYQYLKDEHDIFIDTKKIEGGTVWSNEIKTNISNCDVFVLICTPDAIKSPRVEEEVEFAKNAGKRIIPCIYIKYVDIGDIKWGLNQIQGIEFSDRYELIMHLSRLLGVLKKSKGSFQEPNPAEPPTIKEKQPLTTFSLDWYIKRGGDFEEIGRYNEALNMYNNAIKLAPYNFGLLLKKVILLGKLKQFDAALQTLDEAIVLEPKNKDIWHYKGIYFAEKGKYEDALEAIETSIRINSNDLNVWDCKLRILEYLGKDNDALEAIEKILSLDKNNVNIWNSKGNILIKLNRHSDALKAFETILGFDPDNPDALYTTAEILLKLEEYDNALKYYNKAVKIKPSQKNEYIREILKSIQILKLYYNDFPRLVEEYIKRDGDIDSILDDFKTVIEWSTNEKLKKKGKDENDAIINSIYSLYKILEQESHNLRLKEKDSFISSVSDKMDKQLVFVQQIHIRATDLFQNEMIQRSREYLQANKSSFFNILWAKVRDKSVMIRTLDGHTSNVNSVAITPDGTKIVSGSDDYTVKVWDIASGCLRNTLQDHTFDVNSVAITPDGTKIVSGSWDKTIKVWDLASGGSLVNTLEGYTGYIDSVAITPDGTKIVSGSNDNTLKVLDLASGQLLNTLEGHTSPVKSVAITPDGTKIVSGSNDRTIKVWDLASGGSLVNTLEGHTGYIDSVAITPDGTKIVSAGSFDDTIKVWDLASGGSLVNTLEGHTGYIDSVAITPDGTKIVSAGSFDDTIKVWDLASGGSLVNTLEGHTSNVNSVAITPDGTKIGSGSKDRTIKVWDLNNGSNMFACKFDSEISAIAISKDKNIIAIGDSNSGVYAIDVI